MEIGARPCSVEIRAKEAGVVAGVAEAVWIYERARQKATPMVHDGT